MQQDSRGLVKCKQLNLIGGRSIPIGFSSGKFISTVQSDENLNMFSFVSLVLCAGKVKGTNSRLIVPLFIFTILQQQQQLPTTIHHRPGHLSRSIRVLVDNNSCNIRRERKRERLDERDEGMRQDLVELCL